MTHPEPLKFIAGNNSDEFRMNKLIKDFFDANSIEEVSDTLGLMLENYVGTAPGERTEIAGTTYFINQLVSLLFKLDTLIIKEDTGPVVQVEAEQKCTHN